MYQNIFNSVVLALVLNIIICEVAISGDLCVPGTLRTTSDHTTTVSCLSYSGADPKGQVNGLHSIDTSGQSLLRFNHHYDIVHFLSGFSLKFLTL